MTALLDVDRDDTAPQVRYQCSEPDGCGRSEWLDYVPPAAGGTDATARCRGWRLGERGGVPVRWCPACSGQNPGYWPEDRDELEDAVHAAFAARMAADGHQVEQGSDGVVRVHIPAGDDR